MDEIVVSPELAARFAEALEQSRAVFFSAPCGYGKTAVARALLAGRRTVFADARAENFRLPDPGGDWEVLLLDELQCLRGEGDRRALCAMLRGGERRAVLLSRGPVPAWLIPFQATGALRVFDRSALTLDRDTALRLLRSRGTEPTEEDMDAIFRRTGGYPLALCFAARRLGPRGYDEKCAAAVRADLFDYFETAVYRRFDARMQRFLLELAPFSRFDLSLAELVASGSAGETLDRLQAESAILDYDGVSAFRIRPMFRDFLLWEMGRACTEAQQRAMLCRAGEYYARRGEALPALDCYARAGDRDRAAALLAKCAASGPAAEELPALAQYFRALPEEELRASPPLLRGLAVLEARRGDYGASGRARRALEALGDRASLRWLALSLPQSAPGEVAAALRAPEDGTELPPVSFAGGRTGVLNGTHDLSAWTARELAELAPRISALPGGFGAGECARAEKCFYSGGDAAPLLPELLARMREVQRVGTPETELAIVALFARVRLDAGRPAEARRGLEALRARFAAGGRSRLLPALDALLIQIDLRCGALEGAELWLKNAAPRGDVRDVTQTELYLTRAMAELALGRPADALRTTEPLLRVCGACSRRIDGVTAALLQAAALQRMGQPWKECFEAALIDAERFGLRRAVSALGAAVQPMFGNRRGAAADAVREQTAAYPAFLSTPAAPAAPLTAAEKQVLRLLAENRTNAEICAALGVSLPTVKTHVSHILKKLGVSRRSEAGSAAARLRLLNDG